MTQRYELPTAPILRKTADTKNSLSTSITGADTPESAHNIEEGVMNRAEHVLTAAGLSVPEGWHPVQTRRESHDDRKVTVVRYQPHPERALGGEHVSVVIDDEDSLLGYTRMTTTAAHRPLPDDADAERAAFEWLNGFAHEHAEKLTVQWIDRHDETIHDSAGTQYLISGAKVKTRHSDGLYTWIIVDDRGEVITYERDIRWDRGAGRRGTEMWMHDRWVAAREGTGPQPNAPYAITTS
ncbi:hypothetical protein SAMN04487905_101489 [Actinopolyspora xinjiangensis]|uniref:Uncharacterized protein n=1 Tax=Actinopolyspora xinjiangensis TaxID=405564 RepID=A0A1H0PCG0_9ACTN|nr:hypothetical protein [Actinopolyspora xinjiangensis]SDP02684.1 hypothetical protein SAMN04487905_101489 [Actinopolyspora xinjiangensis]